MTLLQVRAFLVTAGAVWLGGFLLPTEAQAQSEGVLTPRGYFDFTLVVAQPTGDFGLIVERGWGFELGGLNGLNHGKESSKPLLGCTICRPCQHRMPESAGVQQRE